MNRNCNNSKSITAQIRHIMCDEFEGVNHVICAKRIGCGATTYTQYEQGRNLPGLKVIQKFIEAMGNMHFVCDIIEEKKAA